MMNIKTLQIYSSDFLLNVLDLNCINLATEEDKSCKLDYWAKFFKATTWEEIKMLAMQNDAVKEAAVTLCELSDDEKIRMQCLARELNEGDRRSILLNGIEKGRQEQKEIDDAVIADIVAQKDAEIATLRAQLQKK